MIIIANTFNSVTSELEKGFNIGGSIPIFGVLCSAARISAAKVQIVAGVFFTGTGVVAFGFASVANDEEAEHEAKQFMLFGVEYTLHGCLNAYRGVLEILSQVTTLAIATLFYNLSGKDGEEFEPTVKYTVYDNDPFAPLIIFDKLV